MKVYHVYECYYDEPWFPNEDTSSIYSTFEKAQKYGNKLVTEALDEGFEFDRDCMDKDETPMFQGNDCCKFFVDPAGDNEVRIYIDEYEVR